MPPRRSLAERDALVLQYRFLVRRVVKALWSRPGVRKLGFDEAESAGFVGLIRAAEIWDERRDIKFITYAWAAIYQHVVRDELRNRSVLHVADWTLQRGGRGPRVTPLARLPATRHPAARGGDGPFAADDFLAILADSSPDTREVMRGYFVDDETNQETADRMGYSRQRTSQIKTRALRKLRERLGDVATAKAKLGLA